MVAVTLLHLDYLLRLDRPEPLWLTCDEAENFIHTISGSISHDRRGRCGTFRLYYVDFSAGREAGFTAREVLDTYGETFAFAPLVLDRRGEPFSARLMKLIGDEIMFEPNLLIFDRLEILPEFRGAGLGLAVLLRLIGRFSPGTGAVALKAHPLQFEASASESPDQWQRKMELPSLSRDWGRSLKKLQRYYARLGFKAFSQSEFMFRASAMSLPQLDELVSVKDI